VGKEDVETVRAAYEAFNRGDETFFEYLDPEVEWIPAAQFLEGPVKGIDGLKDLLATFADAFEEIRWVPVQLFETGRDGEVLVLIDTHSRGKGSGAEVTVRVSHLVRVRDGKVVWGKVYPDADEGMRVAGIEPPAGPT
jgi:ketosteroid isomerase-like protein